MGLFKIGISVVPWERIQAIRREVGFPVGPVFCIEVLNPKKIESRLHRRFSDFRYIGEWFNLEDANVRQVIDELRVLNNKEKHLH